jgi:3-oxoacyl-[acyl-carrier-protein] synthase III
MLSIEEIKSYLPKNKLDILKTYKHINKKFLTNKIGTTKVTRKNKNEDTVSMCVAAYKKLKKIKKKKIKLLLLCTQNPEGNGLPHNSALIHNKIGLGSNIATMDISQGCAGYVYSLKVCENFLSNNDMALIFTCDPYSKIISKGDYNTDILFGDAATVSIVKMKKKGTLIKDYSFFSNTSNHNAINNFNGKLHMNGRSVMKFAEKYVVKEILNLLKKNQLKIDDVEKFYIHQGSRHIVKTITKSLKLNEKRVPMLIKNIGNTISSSIPIVLEKNNYQKNKNSILCGFGVGLSIATCLIKKI